MRRIIRNISFIYKGPLDASLMIISVCVFLFSCNKVLDETPLSSLNPDITLTSKVGFDAYTTGLIWAAREEYTMSSDYVYYITEFPGTDLAGDAGAEYVTYRNWSTYLNPVTPEVIANWNWAYTKMMPLANTIIAYANRPQLNNIWSSDAEKNAIIAIARFYRAYTYNFLANLYGDVPIVDTIMETPKFDFVRSQRKEVYEFAKNDLLFASKWLPKTVGKELEGQPVKAAADHLLSEVYISLGQYDSAVASASRVINSGLYHLMTNRFGSKSEEPGDVFSDLFRDGNQNRSSENFESILAIQFEPFVQGGGGSVGGNCQIRNFGPFLTHIADPAGYQMLVSDSIGRGVGRVRPSNYVLYGIWKDDWNDMRNSSYNMRRSFYYNNPASPYFGQKVEPRTDREDTMRSMYPYSRKIEGAPWEEKTTSGRTAKDIYVYRLAETYLLRAEAYFRNGDNYNAAKDINIIRDRAHAAPISPGDVDLDYILDERARELFTEEPRRRTLIRMGKLVERVRKFGLMKSSRETIQDYNQFWPIPQEAIDANSGAKLEQNTGY